jgi:hypothetical protein
MRIRLRTMLAAVVVAALLLTVVAGVLRDRRRDLYLRLAAFHERAGARTREMRDRKGRSYGMWSRWEPATRRFILAGPEEVEYRARMRRKYEYAAGHPGLPVEPDPPVPRRQP